MAGERYGVWRMRKHGGWRLVQTFGDRGKAKKTAASMKKQFITVKWGKVR